jgi:ATP-dependent DNA helicase RecG
MDNPERLIALVDEYRALAHELPCVEFKVDNFDPERIGTLISAISNTARLVDQPCGYVIWGVENDTHDVAGTIFRPGKEKAHGQPLELWLSNSVSPSLYFTFKEVPHPKGRLIVLEIPPATQVPTKFKNIAYIVTAASFLCWQESFSSASSSWSG